MDRWTIAELEDRVVRALEAAGYVPPANGQVRPVPDSRTIRYYTTLGLLDRPIEMRGRTALYGPRHLLQICAIKRLQAGGLPLGDIQTRLAGLDDRGLREVARVSAQAAEQGGGATAAPRQTGRRDREPFWTATPASAAPAGPARATPPPAAPPRAESVVRAGPVSAEPVTKLVLARGVELFVAGSVRDAAALARAAWPVIEELRRQGLMEERE